MNDNEPWIKRLLRCQTFVVVNFKATKENKSTSIETHKLSTAHPEPPPARWSANDLFRFAFINGSRRLSSRKKASIIYTHAM